MEVLATRRIPATSASFREQAISGGMLAAEVAMMTIANTHLLSLAFLGYRLLLLLQFIVRRQLLKELREERGRGKEEREGGNCVIKPVREKFRDSRTFFDSCST